MSNSGTTIESTIIPRTPSTGNNQGSTSDDFIFYKNTFIRGRAFLDSQADVVLNNFGAAAFSVAGGIEAGGSFRTLGNATIEKTLTINGSTQSIVALNSASSFLSLLVQQSIACTTLNATTSTSTNILNATQANLTHVAASDLTVTPGNSSLTTLNCSGLSSLADVSCVNTSVRGIFTASGASSIFQDGSIKITKSTPVLSTATISLADDGSFQLQQNTGYNINMITSQSFSILSAGGAASTPLFSCSSTGCSTTVPLIVNNTASTTSSFTAGDTLIANKNLQVKSTTGSSLYTEGAAVINGGLGVAERINAANDISTLTTLRGNALNVATLATLGSVLITSTLNATSPSSASLITQGGLYVAQDVRIGNNVFILSSADVMNGMSSSFQTQGGMSIAKKLFVGDLITGGNGLSITGAGNFSGSLAASSPIYGNSQLNATSLTSASIVSAGGLAVARDLIGGGIASFLGALTTQSSLSVGASLTCGGDANFSGNMNLTKNFNCSGSGTFMGDIVIAGSVTAGGTATQINWKYFQTNDNIILVNSGPSGVSDSGYSMGRYQLPNDSGAGSVVQDSPFYTGTCGGTGNNATAINLGSNASTLDGAYNEMWIMDSNNQVRKIKTYTASTQVATIYSTADQNANNALPTNSGSSSSSSSTPMKWSFPQGLDFTTIPTSTTTFKLYNRHYIMQAFLESNNSMVLGSSPINPTTNSSANIQQTESLKMKSAYLDGSLFSDTISPYTSNGAINVAGISIQNGKISNVTSFNGVKAATPVTIQLIDNASTAVSLPTATFGIYMIYISPTNSSGAGYAGRLMMFNNSANIFGDYQLSASGEQVDVKWTAGNAIQVFHSKLKTNGTGASISYKVVIEAKS